MRQKLIPLIAFLLLSQHSFSDCEETGLIENFSTEKLAITAKVWGFLKYYHPAVAGGELDWDQKLFEVLPKIEACTTHGELTSTLSTWVEQLGEVQKCKKCKQEDDKNVFLKNFDLSWIRKHPYMSVTTLSAQLTHIERNRYLGEHRYVEQTKYLGNVWFMNEKAIDEKNWNSKYHRLLTLFRYWNQVEYFYAYKYLADKNWDDVLRDAIPSFYEPENKIAYHRAILALISSTDDGQAWYRNYLVDELHGTYMPAVQYSIVDGKAIVFGFWDDSLARRSKLQYYDTITHVNDIPINQVIAEFEEKVFPYLPASNVAQKRMLEHLYLLHGHTDSIKLRYVRGDSIFEHKVGRYQHKEFKLIYIDPPPKAYRVLDDSIAYINLARATYKEINELFRKNKRLKAVILELRYYPESNLDILAAYLNKGKKPFSILCRPDLTYPGKFTWDKPDKSGYRLTRTFKGKVVVLINGYTMSWGEWTAMSCMNIPDVTFIGTNSAGAIGSVGRFNVFADYRTSMTSAGIYYPDKSQIQRIGIKPDIVVPRTPGDKLVIKRALEFIKTGN